ncbi:kappa-type opioid receptor-like isoform X1 [Polyodon spathula]|uniref:kappa-type opioid receptor-like isoform X1 n=1 Tax=Polyodon spathula TaxID=7913 RepID=UPI001B7E5783|nr:kappa-type opioid receptor-like isoform X1 [Polyodon spathula]
MIYQHVGVSFDNRTVLSDNKMHTLAIIYISSLSLSLIGSGSVIVVSVIKKRYLDEQARPLFQLALADFLAAAALLATSTIEILPSKLLALCRFCPYGIALAMSFYCTIFLLVMVYAYEAKQAVQGWREASDPDSQQENHCPRKKKTLYLLYFLAWSLPALGFLAKVITILNSATEITPSNPNVTNCFYCSSCILVLIHNDVCGPQDTLKEDLIKILFFLYVLVVLTSCTVLYCKVKQWCRRQQEECLLPVEGDGFSSRNIRGIYVTVRSILLVFLICWTPAFILVLVGLLLHDVSPQSLHFLYILQVLQASTMPLQGFLDSLVYGWFRRNFREVALGERVGLLAYVHSRAFYDESLAT